MKKIILAIALAILIFAGGAVYIGEQRSAEKEQMFGAAQEYIKQYSVEGMEVDLEIIKQTEKWALLKVRPLNIETDTASAVMEKVEGRWVCRDFGTILLGWEEKVPELFR